MLTGGSTAGVNVSGSPLGSGAGSVLSGSNSLVGANAANQTVLSPTGQPAIGVSAGSTNQVTGSAATAGLASGGNAATLTATGGH